MVDFIRQAARNYFLYRKEVKRIDKEIDEKGIYEYVQERQKVEGSKQYPITA